MPTSNDVLSDLTSFLISELAEEGPDLVIDADQPLADLGIQSLELLELVFFIERHFSCKLPKEILRSENIGSLRSIAEFTSSFLNQSQQ